MELIIIAISKNFLLRMIKIKISSNFSKPLLDKYTHNLSNKKIKTILLYWEGINLKKWKLNKNKKNIKRILVVNKVNNNFNNKNKVHL